MTPFKPDSQERRVKDVLEKAIRGEISHPFITKDGWVNKQYFTRVMYLTQSGRAIWNLENRMGVKIEHSDFKDSFGFKSYRLLTDTLFPSYAQDIH